MSIYYRCYLGVFNLHLDNDKNGEWCDYIRIVNCDTFQETIIPVVSTDNEDIIFKCNKKSITAYGGAKTLYCWLADIIKSDFMTGYVNGIISTYC